MLGRISHLRNLEHLFLAGPTDLVDACSARVEGRTAQVLEPAAQA